MTDVRESWTKQACPTIRAPFLVLFCSHSLLCAREETMPAYIRLDDVSPVISYDAGWAVGSTQDPNWVYYSDGGTFHSTPTTNAKATIVFRGTGVARKLEIRFLRAGPTPYTFALRSVWS